MKAYVISANTEIDESQSQRHRILKLWEISSRRHELVDKGEIADVILVADLAGPDWFSDLRNNQLISIYPDKSFAISDSDFPFPLLHGIYTSATRRMAFKSRFRSAGYNLYPEQYTNTFLKGHPGRAYENTKKFLFSFSGRDSSPVRLRLFKLAGCEGSSICDTSSRFAAFGSSPEKKEFWQQHYVQTLSESKYAICPRGVGAASLRLFECMRMGVAPVIISDEWLLPEGPEWESFSLFIPEKDVHCLSDILKAHESEYASRGKLARIAYERYFSDDAYFDYIIDLCMSIKKRQKIPEKWMWYLRNALVEIWKINKHILVP